MTETLFYHLERRSLDDVLPGLIEKTLERGWKALIRVESSERADAIDNLLWTYSEQTFLPHAQSGDGNPKRQPVLITVEEDNPNEANVLFLVGGTTPPPWNAAETKSLTRVVLMFDGRDQEAVARARADWQAAKVKGHTVSYWQQDQGGRWQQRA